MHFECTLTLKNVDKPDFAERVKRPTHILVTAVRRERRDAYLAWTRISEAAGAVAPGKAPGEIGA